MNTTDFDYELPPELIAQTPIEPRDASRLMVIDRQSGRIEHAYFYEIGKYLAHGDLLVTNQTRVFSARLYARKIPHGGRVEVLLLRRIEPAIWEALVGGKRVNQGQRLIIADGLEAEIIKNLGGPRRTVRFSTPVIDRLDKIGTPPLPPYIRTPLSNPERYQTVFARNVGSAAAPTAGLHFTEALLGQIRQSGIRIAGVTLHIGLDTFAPVTTQNPADHPIHTEWCQVSEETAKLVNQTWRTGGRIVAVGTTSVRALETAALVAAGDQKVAAFEGSTSLFILPGYQFQVVSGMITNFHLPKSTLLMMLSAFWDRDSLLAAYETAKSNRYRFYSFGDAMFIR